MFNRSTNFLESVSIFERINISIVAQWKRAGPITQRSVDRYALLDKCFFDDAMYLLKISLCTVDLNNVAWMVQW
jgi:hypothetical protein